ncbi:unnamed protein product [Clavelina lepadiformis]|uniref:Uncharacterized protein n=1 Tax=Clavelina lepadiformis TaxID=159417 RepID=A0ABP0F5I4_CLALP
MLAMSSVNEIIGLLSYMAYKDKLMMIMGDNSRRCVIMENPDANTYCSIGPPMMYGITVSPPARVVALPYILHRLNNYEKEQLTIRTKRILENNGAIDLTMAQAYSDDSRCLRMSLMKDLVSFIENEANSLLA